MLSDHVSQGCETRGSAKGTLCLGLNQYDGPHSFTKPMHRHCKAQTENIFGSVCKCFKRFPKVALPWQSCLTRREACAFFFFSQKCWNHDLFLDHRSENYTGGYWKIYTEGFSLHLVCGWQRWLRGSHQQVEGQGDNEKQTKWRGEGLVGSRWHENVFVLVNTDNALWSRWRVYVVTSDGAFNIEVGEDPSKAAQN